jgi:hypothetical protein
VENENAYYPLAVGNAWTYNLSGQNMVSTVENVDSDGAFIMSSSLNSAKSSVKKLNGEYFGDGYEKGNMQMILKDNLILDDKWDVKFKSNDFDCICKYTVKEFLPSKTVEGVEYKNVVVVEIENFVLIEGDFVMVTIPEEICYAKGIGKVFSIKDADGYGHKTDSLLYHSLK